ELGGGRLLIVPRWSANEAERLVPVAGGGQRAHNFRDDRSSAAVSRLISWGKAVQRVGASFGGRPRFGSLRASGAGRDAVGRSEGDMSDNTPALIHPTRQR